MRHWGVNARLAAVPSRFALAFRQVNRNGLAVGRMPSRVLSGGHDADDDNARAVKVLFLLSYESGRGTKKDGRRLDRRGV